MLVIYDTMWESTAAMAEAILEGASLPGVTASLIHVRRTSLTRIAAEVLDAAAVAFGSATLNRTMMPMAAAALCYLEGLRPRARRPSRSAPTVGGAAGRRPSTRPCGGLEWEIVREPLRAHYRPTPEVLAECREAGRLLASGPRLMKASAGGGARRLRTNAVRIQVSRVLARERSKNSQTPGKQGIFALSAVLPPLSPPMGGKRLTFLFPIAYDNFSDC